MERPLLFLLLFVCTLQASAQTVKGTIADAETRRALPFATIRQGDTKQGIVSDINGKFSFQLLSGINTLHVSYVGYESKRVPITNIDTIFLIPAAAVTEEVVIRPPYEKIKRIVNTAIRNKDNNNPDKYAQYTYEIYYKMYVDLLPNEGFAKVKTVKRNKLDTLSESDRKLADSMIAASRKEMDSIRNSMHIIFSETYSEVAFERPAKRQENVLASRFSGFKKTFFTNIITGVLPFHAYDDYIKLNATDYVSPLSNGWQSRYQFDLADEILEGNDTIFILKYKPKKGITFKSLTGILYIHSNGYAISHITATTPDTGDGRTFKMQQIYRHVNGKWFPRELNYDFIFKKYPLPELGMVWSGHSIIDSVSFDGSRGIRFDKAHSVKLHDSVDLRTEAEWARYRFEEVSKKELNTYTVMDSTMKEAGVDKFFSNATNIAIGRIPIKFIDLDLTRLIAYNTYEGTRLGLGLYTNDRVSKYFSAGGWFGYGFKDKVMKYGGSARFFPTGKKEHWIELAYQNNYRNTGNVNIHPEVDRQTLQTWLLAKVDRIEEFSAAAHGRLGYYELELRGRKQTLTPQYAYSFNETGANGKYDVTEGSLNLRYAYGEKRTPFAGYYFAAGTKYPIIYLQLSAGKVESGTYSANYMKAIAAVTYSVHINRWGKDNFKLMGGIIQTDNDKALPQSLLMAGNGYRLKNDFQFYAWGGFLTMLPYSYFSDRFASLMYRHDFDRYFYSTKFSKPYLSLAHNMLYGTLNKANMAANPGIIAPKDGYHESGLLLNQLLRIDYLNLAYINLNAGVYYHWAPKYDWKANGRFVVGLSVSF